MRKSIVGFLAIATVTCLGLAGFAYLRSSHEEKSEQYRQDCLQHTVAEDWLALESAARAWLDFEENGDEARLYLAEALVQNRKSEEALKVLNAVSPSFQGYTQVLHVRAELLFSELNRPLDALPLWEELLELEPRATVPRQRLIYWYSMTLQRPELQEAILDAIRVGSEPPEAYTYLFLLNDLNFSDGLTMSTRWRLAYPDDASLEVAQAIFAAKQTADKLLPTFGTSTVSPGDQSLVKNCLTKYPDALEPLALTLDQAVFAGDTEQVTRLLQNAPPEAAEDSRFWRFRGWLMQSQGRFKESREAYEEGLRIHPWDWSIRLLLADVLRREGSQDAAADAASLAMQGKELKARILSSPNARELEEDLVYDLLEYFQETGPAVVAEAMARRL
ncbi:MAG: tetratricopeptide repeat protein [Planctomycetaceae bacterium]